MTPVNPHSGRIATIIREGTGVVKTGAGGANAAWSLCGLFGVCGLFGGLFGVRSLWGQTDLGPVSLSLWGLSLWAG